MCSKKTAKRLALRYVDNHEFVVCFLLLYNKVQPCIFLPVVRTTKQIVLNCGLTTVGGSSFKLDK